MVEVLHPGKANVSKAALCENLAKSMKVSNAKTIQLFGFRTAFGGGKSTGFGLIYDDVAALMKFEPKYRKIRGGFLEAKTFGGMNLIDLITDLGPEDIILLVLARVVINKEAIL